ncbi:hypothetical protein HIC20_02845 [Buchnera aphidicola (Hormaphis cornu)]|nr:hypothetical protein HIC20_02845 [Buchnera aphidicola (Hormaphis cornu)]
MCNETSFYVYLDYKSILNNTDFINWIFKQGSLKFFLYDVANINNNTDEKLFDCSDKLACGFFVFRNFVRVMMLEENQLQLFVSKLRDNILLLEKLYFFSNIVKHSRDLIFLVNQKNYLKTKTFKFKVHLCKELFQLPWKLLCEQRYIKKINKTILFDFYSALALNKFYISEQFDNLKKIGFLDVRLKLFNNKLDLYINSQNKIMLKLLRSRTLILKNALKKHGVFLRTVSINK